MIPQQEPWLENEIGTFALPAGQEKQSIVFSGKCNCLRGENAWIERALQSHITCNTYTGLERISTNPALSGYGSLESVFPTTVYMAFTCIIITITTTVIT